MKVNNRISRIINPPFQQWGIFCFNPLCFILIFISLQFHSQSKIKFDDEKQSFGVVRKGELLRLEYSFTNIGDQPLIILDYKVACTCTSAELPKEPIAPGQKGKIIVIFDTKTVYDRQDRDVEIISNAINSTHKIRFKGFVKKIK